METSVDKCLAFCQSLAMSGQKFSFTLSIGKDNFSFSNKELGSSSCAKKKKKSPSQVRREQRRKEERSFKKAAEPTEKVVKASESDEKSGSKVNSALLKCSQCDLSFKAEEDLNAHVGDLHTTLPTPEKERAPDQIADLLLTPIHEQRRVSGTMPSPPSSLPVVCDLRKGSEGYPGRGPCEETFSSEDDFRVHVHEKHFRCDRRYTTPCPCEGCPYHEKS